LERDAIRALQEADAAVVDYAVDISQERASTDEATRLLMADELQRIIEINAQYLAEAATHEVQRAAQNEEYRSARGALNARPVEGSAGWHVAVEGNSPHNSSHAGHPEPGRMSQASADTAERRAQAKWRWQNS
jgi:hypothetical protein